MSVSASNYQEIRKQVLGIRPGEIFGYSRFLKKGVSELSLAKIFSRLYKEGTITRLSKGKYYIPKQTAFGKLRPTEPALVDALTKRPFEIKDEDTPKFQLLDALQDIKNIPDSPAEYTVSVLKEKINSLSTREKDRLILISLQ